MFKTRSRFILESSSKTKNEVKSGLLLNVVVAQGTTIFQLLASKDKTLLVWGDSFFVLDLGLDVVNGIARLNLEGNGLSGKCLDKDLHTSSKTKNEVKSGLFLDVVVAQSTTIFQLLASKDKTLLVWGNTFLVLDLGLDVVNGIARLNLEGDGLSSKCLDEDLHTSSKTKNEVKSGLFLDVVVAQGTTIFQLLAGKDKTLLVWGDTFFVLDLGLDVVDGIARLNLEGDGLSGKCLDEDLHTSSKTKNEVKSGLFLDVVVAQGTTIFQLLAGKDKTLLVWGDAFFVLDLGLDVVDGIARLNLEGDGLPGKCLDEDLHTSSKTKNEVKSGLFLDVVVAQGTTIFQLLASKDKTLLVWGDTFFVLDLGLDVVDGIARLNFKSNCLSGKCFHEYLHFEKVEKRFLKTS